MEQFSIDDISRRLPFLLDWWPNRPNQQLDEHIVSNTHLLLARIPRLDRKIAIDSYAYTLYHGLTKSWALVSFPNQGVFDIRIFNPDPEDLKTACSAIVADLKKLEYKGQLHPPGRLELNHQKIELLVFNRDQYQDRQMLLAELPPRQAYEQRRQ